MKHRSIMRRPAARPDNGVSVQRHEAVGDGVANVLFHFAGKSNPANIDAVVASAFDNKVRLLPGSAYLPQKSDPDLVMAMVVLNRETRAAGNSFGNAPFADLSAITDGVYRDDSGSIWTKVGEGEEAFLVKDSDDDLTAILAARQAGGLVTASVAVNLHEPATPGAAIGWYDTGRETMRYGACLATAVDPATKVKSMYAMDADTGAVCEIAAEQVHIVADAPPLIASEIATASAGIIGSGSNRNTWLKAFMKYAAAIYGGTSGPYYKRMKSILADSLGRHAVA